MPSGQRLHVARTVVSGCCRSCSAVAPSIVETERCTRGVQLSMLQVEHSMPEVELSTSEVQVLIGTMERRTSAVEVCTKTVPASWSGVQRIDTRHAIIHRQDQAIHLQHGRLRPAHGTMVPADGRLPAQQPLAVQRDRPLPILPASERRSSCLRRVKDGCARNWHWVSRCSGCK